MGSLTDEFTDQEMALMARVASIQRAFVRRRLMKLSPASPAAEAARNELDDLTNLVEKINRLDQSRVKEGT